MKALLKEAGITKDARLHDARHTCGTLLGELHVDIHPERIRKALQAVRASAAESELQPGMQPGGDPGQRGSKETAG